MDVCFDFVLFVFGCVVVVVFFEVVFFVCCFEFFGDVDVCWIV